MKRQKARNATDEKQWSTGSVKHVAERKALGLANPDESPGRLNSNGESDDHSHTRIAELAYTFYEQEGHCHGHDLEHWLKAEQEIKSQKA